MVGDKLNKKIDNVLSMTDQVNEKTDNILKHLDTLILSIDTLTDLVIEIKESQDEINKKKSRMIDDNGHLNYQYEKSLNKMDKEGGK
jgi:uncharacterized coiled-coil DUF342 family protein